MLAQRQRAQSIRIRYYLATEQGLFRVPQRLHQELLAGERSLPEFASSDQRLVEVIARQITRSTYVVSTLGVVYRFDEEGAYTRDIDDVFAGILEPVKQGNLIHFNRAKKARQARERRTWGPSKSQLQLVKHDIVGGRLERPLPIFRPRS
jgi:hypothetical protein